MDLNTTKDEEKTIPVCFKEAFAAAKLGTRTLFANFEEEPVWVTKAHATWKYVSTNKDVDISEIVGWFPYYQQLENLDPYSGTAYFDEKHVYYSTYSEKWNYLNNRTVHFNGSEASESNQEASEEEDEEDRSEEEDNQNPSEPGSDTAKVNKLLLSAETSVTSALQKISSRPGTPAQQTSTLPGISRDPSPEPSQVPTPPVSKGKQPAPPPRPRSLVPSTSTVPARPSTPKVAPPPVPKGNTSGRTASSVPHTASPLATTIKTRPQVPSAPAMAATPRPVGAIPEAYDGKASSAIAFWNTLENYYTVNTAVYADEKARIQSALTHFKLGTQAREWASDQIATALGVTPTDYGTWAEFKKDFNTQFIPPQTQVDAIAKMHSLRMGNREFNEWFQEWSAHCHRANIDEGTKMYAFCRALNQALNQKLVNISPQPTTLDALVEKARDLDRNWHIYAAPLSE